jgi:hypothetical protein
MGDKKKRIAVLVSSSILVTGLFAIGFTFSSALAAATTSLVPPVNLKTNNGSVNISIDWSPKELHQGKDIQFTINFKDPSSGVLLQHVNYNLEVKDAQGNTVKSLMGLHTHTGNDVQTISFDKTGNFNLVITVLGTGLTMPFDTAKSGTAETPIVVVP